MKYKVINYFIITIIITISAASLSGSTVIYRENEKTVLNSNKINLYEIIVKKIQPPGYQLITARSDRGVFVFGKKIDSQPYYEKVLVKTKNTQREFNWKATKRNPQLMIADITGSGEESIVIVFVTAVGTGFLQSEAHVVDMALTREITVEDPAIAAGRLITSSVIGNKIVFKSEGVEYTLKLGTGTPKPPGEYSNLNYGSIVNYSVENNKLQAHITVQTSAGKFLGEFTLTYFYGGGRLIPKVTGFKGA